VAHAVVGMNRAQGRAIVQTLLDKYENRLDDASKGRIFQECYDWDSIEPKQECVELYEAVKDDLTGYRLSFK